MTRRSSSPRFVRRAVASTRNMLELLSLGRLGQPYGAPYEVVDQGPHHRLRRYATCAAPDAPPALLVPPLMVTSEVYDIEEENSAVAALGRRGVLPFVVDFGAPEREAGGMARTLDDHVLAVLRSIERVRALTGGQPVHLCGYSQGGMFAYQAAAVLRSAGIASVVTFGSPVDIHRSLPRVHRDATAAMIRLIEPVVTRGLEQIEGLPGVLTSTAFKLVSTRKEIQQRVDFVRKLHDRGALVRREARRRFLGGEGFVAWPGPAFRAFVDQFIVHNRMLSGGFVLDGRAATLADITCPILAFVGGHDEIARPAAVRAITGAAPEAAVSFVTVEAGHFGIVVGSRAMRETWPTVAEWVHHHAGRGPAPRALAEGGAPERAQSREKSPEEFDEAGELDLGGDLDLFLETVTDALRAAWRRLGDVASSASDAYDGVRYQEPRLRRLAALTPRTRVSPSGALAARARETPEATFFLWRGRAFTYQDADRRVTNVVRGLYACGVRPGDRVGVLMGPRPSYLSMATALSRLGAVAVLAPPDARPDALREAFARAGVRAVAADPDHAALARAVTDGEVLVLGGGARSRGDAVATSGVRDMEAIDPAAVTLPRELALDAGVASDLALILLRPSESGALRAAPVTHHRWALSALGAAAACTLKPEDTVYSCIPLHHPTGILVSVGSALVGGARLALAARFDVTTFWHEVRRYGATVVFYAGEMLRPLVHAPPARGERTHPVRLFAGSGMRTDLWARLAERFGAGVMEFYASTSQRVIMANASGAPLGALGRSLPGSAETAVARVDAATGAPARDADGRVVRAATGEAGLLLARLEPDDDAGEHAAAAGHVLHDAFAPGDRWYASNDVVRVDAAGETWFVDARAGFVRGRDGAAVSTRKVEDALYALPEVRLAAAWGEADGGVDVAVVAHEPLARARIGDALAAALAPGEHPTRVVQVDALELTDGFRPSRAAARERAREGREVWRAGEPAAPAERESDPAAPPGAA